ncbi:MAG: cytidine deaminase [Calditrichaeota bacterium]|nr:cytidine deaminase [Calditrichota bacterium]
MENKKIFPLLKKTREKALALYSNFKVSAVLVTKEGKLYTGHNIESSSYGLTICAERVAVFKALSEGERKFDKIYIMADGPDFSTPCGACRQILNDYAPDVEVILVKESGETRTFQVSELLPEAFGQRHLQAAKK